ncbi:endonuclease/exonuclease/phosphatase family protein [Alicyclobacillus fastidiosus]|uniref:Endonuclease/exonuclease/phosphatase family protein n=1 Tax=Alicyclobacillus fastidiosus TaxID=392011 RepID=A0ABV5AAK0_9BACL|nr:endonuclease/exonuclease/phosphatase family protein [Alicyclobacillus fastidiosus]WEH11933.1 endonuclease/exonuclease/phosphatase family protein [Alicyclobacillus fastidiosus]
MDITVMSMNLRVHVKRDGVNAWPRRVPSVGEVIREHGPDIIGVQEALVPMMDDLKIFLAGYERVGKGRDGKDQDEHCAIYVRSSVLSIKKSGQFWLSETPSVPSTSWDSACPRICTWVLVSENRVPASQLLILNTHLDHMSQSAREHGAVLIASFLKSFTQEHQCPAILMGDLNSTPDNPVVQFLSGQQNLAGNRVKLTDASVINHCQTPAATFHGFSGRTDGETIDYVFLTPDIHPFRFEVDQRHYLERYPSDHFPVIVGLGVD